MTWGGSDALWSSSPAGKKLPTKPSTVARHGKKAAQHTAWERESPLRSLPLSPTTVAEKGQRERERETLSEGVYPDRESIALTSSHPPGASPAKNGTASEGGRECVACDNADFSGRGELFDVQLSDPPAVGIREAACGNVEKGAEEEVKLVGVGESSKMKKSATNTLKEEPREEQDGDARSAVTQQGVGVYSEGGGLIPGSVALPVRHSPITETAPVLNAVGGKEQRRKGEWKVDSGGGVKGDGGNEKEQEEELDIISLSSPDDRRGGLTSPTPALPSSPDSLPLIHSPSHASPSPASPHTPPHLPQVDSKSSFLTPPLLKDGATETTSDLSPRNSPLGGGRGDILSGVEFSSQNSGSSCLSAKQTVAAAEPLKDQLASSQPPSLPPLSSPSPLSPLSPSSPLPLALLDLRNKTEGPLSSFLEGKSKTDSGRNFFTCEHGNSPEDGAARLKEEREGLEGDVAGHQSMKIRVVSNESGSSIVGTGGDERGGGRKGSGGREEGKGRRGGGEGGGGEVIGEGGGDGRGGRSGGGGSSGGDDEGGREERGGREEGKGGRGEGGGGREGGDGRGGGGEGGGGGKGKEGGVEGGRVAERGMTLRVKEEKEEEGGEEADRLKEGGQVVVGVGGDRRDSKDDVRQVEKGVEEAALLQVGAWYLN